MLKLEIADIATNEKKRLNGFKVLGIFPFYLKYITTGTHIRLCAIRSQIQDLMKDREPAINDFYDPALQTKLIPLINNYIITALTNNRFLGWFFRWALDRKIKRCGHYHILNLFITIQKLDEPAFFLSYWKLINQVDNTLLKEVKR
jgi:hypothetical protein